MNNSMKKTFLGLTLIAMGMAAGWGLAQWRAGTAHVGMRPCPKRAQHDR